MNETHDPSLQSWVDSANAANSDFPIQNLPFGIFSRRGDKEGRRKVGVAIGDRILDVTAGVEAGIWTGIADEVARAASGKSLNAVMQCSRESLSEFRLQLSRALAGIPNDARPRPAAAALVPMGDVEMHVPAEIGDYTDFYASIYHATNVGKLFRPDNPLLPNYKHVPIGYHGRASSIVPTGTWVTRPLGQTRPSEKDPPVFGPSRLLDYEAEAGFFVSRGNSLGQPIGIDEAEDHIFGLCIVNDWSARDIQAWEYQPLGPFLAKNFATTVSPWVLTMEALEPFRSPAFFRPAGDPKPLPYLSSDRNRGMGGIDLTIEVYIRTSMMREAGLRPHRLSQASLSDMYWTPAQLLTHHASNGCNLRPGDLFASGTVSGPESSSLGCLLELTRRGAEAIHLPSGEDRKFLQDRDEIIMRGFLEREGAVRIGTGECAGLVVAAASR
ncbi:MAG TPA: fumarylacetoacetase [Gemmatimonadaceae bacterium]|nr:fumarylacetoacetase [Gemmatimonadaceae bacterium]